MRSLRARLTVYLLLGMGALLLVAGVVLSLLIDRTLERQFDQALLAKARALITLTKEEQGEVELDFADEFMPEFQAKDRPEYFQLWLPEGTVLERSRSLGTQDLPRWRELEPTPRLRDASLPDGRWGRLVQVDFVPQVEDDEEAEVAFDPQTSPQDKVVTLVVARERAELDSLLRSLHLTLGTLSALLMLAIVALVRSSLRLGLRPLAEVTRQVGTLGASHLDSRVAISGVPTEIVPVMEQLNALLHRLEEAFTRERQLSSDVAHELRTPIAELRSLAEVGPKVADDPEAIEAFFKDVADIGVQMEQVVVHLLKLARYEGGIEEVQKHQLSLLEVVDTCWARLEPRAAARNIVLVRDLGTTRIYADRQKLELVVGNLLSNAISYGVPGGPVFSSGRQNGERTSLTISNPTVHLKPEDIPHLFDRFWRKDASRTGGEHAGLGLSLTKAICGLLGLEVTASIDRDRTFHITITGSTDPPLPQEG